MADERDGSKKLEDSTRQAGAAKDQTSPLNDLEAGADEVEKVKGGRMGDPCDGGEVQ
jgi:hypothetical protein